MQIAGQLTLVCCDAQTKVKDPWQVVIQHALTHLPEICAPLLAEEQSGPDDPGPGTPTPIETDGAQMLDDPRMIELFQPIEPEVN